MKSNNVIHLELQEKKLENGLTVVYLSLLLLTALGSTRGKCWKNPVCRHERKWVDPRNWSHVKLENSQSISTEARPHQRTHPIQRVENTHNICPQNFEMARLSWDDISGGPPHSLIFFLFTKECLWLSYSCCTLVQREWRNQMFFRSMRSYSWTWSGSWPHTEILNVEGTMIHR